MLPSPGMVVTAMVLSVIKLRFSAGQQCTEAINVTEALDCNFLQSQSMCGWQSVSTSEVRHHWILESGLVARFQGNDPNNSTARIKSQLICATDTDQYSLKFRYKMSFDNLCRLTILLTTKYDTYFTEIWSNAARIDTPTWESVNIISPSHDFKLAFQAKKLPANRYCDIVLSETKFQHDGSLSTTPFTPTSDTYLPATPEEVEGGLSGGAIAGIIVGLIFVVALCVFVFLLIRRRNAGGDKQSGSLPHYANSTDTGGLETGTSHHEHPDIPESSNYYSMPLEEDGTPAGSQAPVVEYSNEMSGARIFTVEPGSPYYINVGDRDPSRDYWTRLQPSEQDKNLYLSLRGEASSRSTSRPGRGGYLEGNTSSTYLTPIPDGGTEDAYVGRRDPYENNSAEEAYVNTKAN